MLVEMRVSGLAVDPFTNTPVVILKDIAGRNGLPIWIGMCEAGAIATELEKIELARPMTHDLIKNILGQLSVEVVRVEVNDLRDSTYYATIVLRRDGHELDVDARPSDALALALRTGASVWVEEAILEKARQIDLRGRSEEAGAEVDEERYREFLVGISDEPAAKWKM